MKNIRSQEESASVDLPDGWLDRFKSKTRIDDGTDNSSNGSDNNNTSGNGDLILVPNKKYEYYYKMDHERRGLALIFNHQKFSTRRCRERHGSDVDRNKLKKCFQDLHFDVQVFNNLKYDEIIKQIQFAVETKHTTFDCFVLVVLTHGDQNILYSSDGIPYDPREMIFDKFTADNCPTLAGKPKIFVMQACQGAETDRGIQVAHRTEFDGGFQSYSIPIRADFLIVYATSQGHYAFRNTDKGSYFIQVLCDELSNHAAKEDLLHILTFVNQRVAVEFVSKHDSDPQYHEKKQMPYFQSYLTRFVHFGSYEQQERQPEPVIRSIRKK